MQVSLNMFRAEAWFAEDIFPILELIEIADRKGIDLLSLSEHVVMGKDTSAYPYGGVFTAETNFYEPLILAGHIGARTTRIRIATSVLIAPLRPAVLLAKMVATADVLSRGRMELGLGVGWQKAEYDFSGVAWDGRFGHMVEIIEACRLLWTQAPATYRGKHIDFQGAYSKPFPVQAGGPPILLGVAPTDINIRRIVAHADGWCPLGLSLDQVAEGMDKIRAHAQAAGRDMREFRLKLPAPMVRTGDKPDLEATLAGLPKLKAVGCTEVNFSPLPFCAGPEAFAPFVDRLIAARDAL